MMLHREEYYHKSDPNWADENPDKVGTAEVILAKQRNGPTGTVHLVWDGNTTRFKNQAYGAPPEEAFGGGGARRVIAPTRPRAAAEPVDDFPV
jgi:replicative DNA helicase